MPVAVIGPAGRFLLRQAPVVGGHREELVLAEVGLDLQQRAERARARQALQLQERRLEAALVADRERHAVRAAGLDRRATSARVSDSGFSQNTCFFAAAARTICSQCSECGVQRTTPSMPGLLSVFSKLLENSRPFSRQKTSAVPDARSTPATAFSLSLPFSRPMMIRPHHPRPTTATLSIYSVGLAMSPPRAARPQAENCASVLKLKCPASACASRKMRWIG